MINISKWRQDKLLTYFDVGLNNLAETANDICEEALNYAKSQLHPLLWNVNLNQLDRRAEFIQAFKGALEQGIAQKLSAWPGVQAVFKFDDDPRTESKEGWDGSVHLLAMSARPSNAMTELGRILDQSLVKCLKRLGWSRFQMSQSVLEIQQVTPKEIQRGISYGAMFHAVYTSPVKVWPRDEIVGMKDFM